MNGNTPQMTETRLEEIARLRWEIARRQERLAQLAPSAPFAVPIPLIVYGAADGHYYRLNAHGLWEHAD